LVQAQRDLVDLRLRVGRQVGASREVLPQQQIGVFVGAALSGTLRITEVDLNVGRYREVFLVHHHEKVVVLFAKVRDCLFPLRADKVLVEP
jgi:hypothetical protein